MSTEPHHVISRRGFFYVTVGALALAAVALRCAAAELEQATAAAFQHYVEVAEQQMQTSLQPDGPFLWIDFRPESIRKRFYQQLREGQFVIRRLDTYDDGKEIDIPDGMVHHWIGLAFISGASLKSAEAVLEDYQDYATIYAPQVRRSRVQALDGDSLKLFLQLYKDSPRRVAYNAEFRVQRMRLSRNRIASSSTSTRIAQLRDPSQPNGPEYPVGNDSGYLWRMNNYWRYEQKDGGVYMQVEAISLSRDVPPILGWFVRPIIRRVARETIAGLLEANRRAIQNPGQYAPHADIVEADSAARGSASPSR